MQVQGKDVGEIIQIWPKFATTPFLDALRVYVNDL